jgi:TetR/AcrR family transcriptional repressor of nem operon
LPAEAAEEVERFFNMCLDKLVDARLSKNAAAELLSTITGALVVANALSVASVYDRATRSWCEN